MGELLHLVPTTPSTETVEALVYLLEEARAGRVIGMAWVAIHRGREYSVDFTGEIRAQPTFSRGMLDALDDELAGMVPRRRTPG